MLVLLDITGAIVNTEGISIQKKIAEMVSPHAKKIVVLGVTGIKKSLLISVNFLTGLGATPYDDEVAAKEWLAKD